MTILRNSTVFSAATAVLAVVLLSAGASAQERSTAADSATTGGELPGQAQIAAWIEQLDAPEFAERQRAEAGLTTIGSGAVVSLKKALPDSSPERRLRIENLLRRLERNSVAKLTEELARHPDAGAVVRLKQGRRFLELVGTDAAAVGLFARMLKAEPELFTAAEESRPITELLEQRAQAVNQSTRPVPERMDRFSADSFAALLLLCSDDSLRLGSASASVSTVLVQPDFATAINDEAVGGLLKRLVGAYILRERIAVDLPLTFARRFPLPEGLTLARRVISGSLRGTSGMFAMMLIAEQGGGPDDIKLLESAFDNRGRLVSQGTRYMVTNGDLAMCVAVHLRGRDPRDFGFAPQDDRSRPFRFAPETAGFRSDEERNAARERYRLAFLQ